MTYNAWILVNACLKNYNTKKQNISDILALYVEMLKSLTKYSYNIQIQMKFIERQKMQTITGYYEETQIETDLEPFSHPSTAPK